MRVGCQILFISCLIKCKIVKSTAALINLYTYLDKIILYLYLWSHLSLFLLVFLTLFFSFPTASIIYSFHYNYSLHLFRTSCNAYTLRQSTTDHGTHVMISLLNILCHNRHQYPVHCAFPAFLGNKHGLFYSLLDNKST